MPNSNYSTLKHLIHSSQDHQIRIQDYSRQVGAYKGFGKDQYSKIFRLASFNVGFIYYQRFGFSIGRQLLGIIYCYSATFFKIALDR